MLYNDRMLVISYSRFVPVLYTKCRYTELELPSSKTSLR